MNSMLYFALELLALSLVGWFLLDREFKRLKRLYKFRNYWTITFQAGVISFTEAMRQFGYSAERASESMRRFSQTFHN